MADAQKTVADSTATPAEGQPPKAGSQVQSPTVEQVEAEYKARISGKDRAHAAEAETLRTRIAALEAEQKASGDRTAAEQDAIKQENETLRKTLTDRETAYAVDVRKTKYPNAAEALEPGVLAAMDEGKLAGLEARLSPAPAGEAPKPAPQVDPSTAPKGDTSPKPTSEQSVEELEATLARQAPDFLSTLR